MSGSACVAYQLLRMHPECDLASVLVLDETEDTRELNTRTGRIDSRPARMVSRKVAQPARVMVPVLR